MPVLTSMEMMLAGSIGVLMIVLLLVVYFFKVAINKLQQQTSSLQTSLIKMGDELAALANQKEEDQARVVLVTRHFKEIEAKQEQLELQLKDVKMQDPSMRLYQRAAELVKSGASLDDVMQACDLPRAEAELLIQVHKSK